MKLPTPLEGRWSLSSPLFFSVVSPQHVFHIQYKQSLDASVPVESQCVKHSDLQCVSGSAGN